MPISHTASDQEGLEEEKEEEWADLAASEGEAGLSLNGRSHDQMQCMISLLTHPPLAVTAPKVLALPEMAGLFSAPGSRGLLEVERLRAAVSLLDLFRLSGDTVLGAVVSLLGARVLATGEVLQAAGEACERVSVVLQGSLLLVAQDSLPLLLSEGATVSELELLQEGKRVYAHTATAQADNTVLLSLTVAQYDRYLRDTRLASVQGVVRLLSGLPLFQGVVESHLLELACMARELPCVAGTLLLEEGRESSHVPDPHNISHPQHELCI